jgi:hypothetical protein
LKPVEKHERDLVLVCGSVSAKKFCNSHGASTLVDWAIDGYGALSVSKKGLEKVCGYV